MRLTAVSYLNTKPLLYGLLLDGIDKEVEISLDIPAICAQKLLEGHSEIGLIPSAMIPQIRNAEIFSDYCIGAEGAVKSVCIYSQVPIEQVSSILLDHESKTSVALTKILCKEYWKISPEWLTQMTSSERLFEGRQAVLQIGDKTFGMTAPFIYDLAEVWKEWTKLPFVFAAWVNTVPISSDFKNRFNAALKKGVENIPQLLYLISDVFQGFDLKDYFQNAISYELSASKREALELFWQKIRNL